MEYFKEEEFFKDNGYPTEELKYCAYRFNLPMTETQSEYGCDYDQFALICNAEYPYIRLTKKRGKSHFPCGGNSCMATDGHFASSTDEERNAECPKVAWGISAWFIANLGYDNEQKDYYLLEDKKILFERYYNERLNRYLQAHNGLRYSKIPSERKELDFIEIHLPIIKGLWEHSAPLRKYCQLYSYAEEAELEYEEFIQNRIKELSKITMGVSKQFSTAISEVSGNQYIKVYFLDDSRAEEARDVVESLNEVKKVNITESKSIDHKGQTLTVYPKSMVPAKDCKGIVESALEDFS